MKGPLCIKTSSRELSSAYDTRIVLSASPMAYIQTSSLYIRSNRLREDVYRGYNDNINRHETFSVEFIHVTLSTSIRHFQQ